MKNIFQKPYINALSATLYIVGVVSIMQHTADRPDSPEFITAIVMLSLFVLSAAVMAFLFFSQPVLMYLDGQKKEAVSFFGKTIGFFACTTLVLALVFILFW